MLEVQTYGNGCLSDHNCTYMMRDADRADCPPKEQLENVHGAEDLGANNHHVTICRPMGWKNG